MYRSVNKVAITCLALLSGLIGLAQTPTITSFSPVSGPAGTVVTIDGTNFDADPGNNTVFFGAVEAEINSAGGTQLEVVVPLGATYQPITVTVNNLTAYSLEPFIVTFSSGGGIDVNSFAPVVSLSTGAGTRTILQGDLDVDGKSDLITLNQTNNSITLHRNVAASGDLTASSFEVGVSYGTGTNPVWSAIGDLDGDGKLDLTSLNLSALTASVYLNTTSTGKFTSSSLAIPVNFTTLANAEGMNVADLDGDGKPEMMVPNSNNNTVSVFLNTSTVGNVSYAAGVEFTAHTTPKYVTTADIDGDGKIDMVVANRDGGTVSIIRNTSTVGALSFAPSVSYATGTTPWYLAVGDLDDDGKPDVVIANEGSNTVKVFRNTSPVGGVSFDGIDLATGIGPRGLGIADIDGDGKLDIVVSHTSETFVSVFRNVSSPGVLLTGSFEARVDYSIGTTGISLTVGDLDRDGKNDIAVSDGGTIALLRNDIQPPAALAYYPFNGNALDESGNGLDATEINAVLTTDRFGNSNSAYHFTDNANSYIRIDNATAFDFTDFTYSVWIKPDQTYSPGFHTILDIDDDLALLAQNENFYEIYGTCFGSGGEVKEGWHQLIYTKSGVDYKLFLDGEIIAQGSGCTASIDGNYLIIGGDQGGENFHGTIDDIGIYNYALSDIEVQQLYAGEAGISATYPFNGTTADVSGLGFDAVLGDGATSGTFPILTADRFGTYDRAYEFDGIDDYMTSQVNLSTNQPFSISAWVFWDGDNGNFQDIVSWWDASQGSSPYLGTSATTGEIRFGDTWVPAGIVMPAGKWAHLVATFDGSFSRLYLDNQLIAVSGSSMQYDFTNGSLEIGKQRQGGEYWDGKIDDLRIYSHSLSEGEITNLYEADGWPLIVSMPFNGDASDHSGNGHDGILSGGVVESTDRFGNSFNGYAFDGVDDAINIGGTELLYAISDDYTLSAWINPSTFPTGEMTILSNYDGASGFSLLLSDISGGVADELKADVFGAGFVNGGILTLNSWNHVAMTFVKGQSMKLFLNGQVTAEVTPVDVSVGLTSNEIVIGNGIQGLFNGSIDDVRIYGEALDEIEINSLYVDSGWPLNNSSQLVMQYNFEGNADDWSGNDLHGTVNGATLADDRFGNPNSAYYFDGADDGIESNGVVFSQNMSIAMWINADLFGTGSTNQVLIGERDQVTPDFLGDGNFQFEIEDSNLSFTIWDNLGNTHNVTTAATSMVSGTWHHVAVTYDNSSFEVRLYQDGVEQDMGIVNFGGASKNTNSSYPILYGKPFRDNAFGDKFAGSIDDIRIYDGVLSASEINALFNEAGPPPEIYDDTRAFQVAQDHIRMTWSANSVLQGYNIHQSTDGGINFTEIASAIENDVGEWDILVTAGQSYVHALEAYNATSSDIVVLDEILVETLATPIVDVSPSTFTLDDQVTLTYYPDRSFPKGELVGQSPVYIHSGLVQPGNENGAWDGGTVVGNFGVDDGVGQMTDNGDGSWSITMTPRSYYGVDNSYVAAQIGMVFRNADIDEGLLEGKGEFLSDIYLDVQPSSTLDDPGVIAYALSSTSIQIIWNDVADESGYRVFRSTDDATWTQINDSGVDETRYNDSGLTPNTVYYYYVEAYDATPYATASASILERTFSDDLDSRMEEFGSFGGPGNDYGRSTVVDADGNIYFTGSFYNNMDVNGTVLQADGGVRAAFLIKFNPAGNIIWTRVFDAYEPTNASGYAYANMVNISPSGELYLAGRYAGNLNGFQTVTVLDGSSNFSHYETNPFLIKIDPSNGSEIWTRTLAADGYSSVYDIAFDNSENIYASGNWLGSASFAGNGMTGGGPMLLKYDLNGNEIWVQVGVQTTFDFAGIASDVISDGNNIYITGNIVSNTTFGSATVTDQAGGEVFVVKYDVNGAVIWVAEASGDNSDRGFDIILDDNNDPYITGHFQSSSLSSGSITVSNSSPGSWEIFLMKLDQSTGDAQWGLNFGSGYDDFGIALATDGTNVYVTGSKEKADADFGGITVENGNLFVASVDDFGTVNWVDVNEGFMAGRAMTYDNGYLYIPGYYAYVANIGGSIFTSESETYDAFLGKMQVEIPFNNGLIGFYSFDDGMTYDDSGNGYDGTVSAGTNNSPQGYMDRYGDQNSSAYFDNDGGYVQIDHLGDWDFTNEFTWSGWINTRSLPDDVTTSWTTIFDSQSEQGQLVIKTNGALNYLSGFDAVHTESDNFFIETNRWYMVTLRVDASNTASIFADGNLITSTTFSRGAGTGTIMQIGSPSNNFGGSGWFNGRIDDVRFYDIALSDSEIQEIFDLERSDNLIVNYPFNNGSLVNDNGNGFDLSEKDVNNNFAAPGTIATTTDRRGDPSGAYDLANSGNFLEVYHGTVDFGGQWDLGHDLTVNAWINSHSLPQTANNENWDVIISNTQGDRLIVDGDGSLVYHWWDGANWLFEESFGGVITPGVWQMVTYTWDSNNNLRLYVDGILVHSMDNLNREVYTGDHFWIGSNDFGLDERYFDGLVDDVSIWERTLSAAEILNLYGDHSLLAAWYPFNGNARDESGNGWDATVLGAILTSDKEGNPNSAYNFDAVGYIEGPKAINSQENFTWMGWFKTSLNGTIMAITDPNINNWSLGAKSLFQRDGNIVFDVANIGEIASIGTVNDNVWHHVALTAEMDVSGSLDLVTIYIDGIYDNSRSDWDINGDSDLGFVFRIGHTSLSFPTNPVFQGDIDEVAVYSDALTADQILDIFKSEGGTAKEELAHFTFSGDASDVTGNGFDGDLCCLDHNFADDRFGTAGSALEMLNFSGNIDLPRSFELKGEFTVSAWVNIPDDGSNHFIMSEAQNNLLWNFVILIGGQVYLEYWDENGDLFTGQYDTETVPFNTWTHVGVTFSLGAGEVRLYMDGNLKVILSLTGVGLRSDASVIPSIGGYHDGTNDFGSSGIYDDIHVFNYALTDTEIQDLYNDESPNAAPVGPTNLIAKIVGPTSVSLSWSDQANNETNYGVQWEESGTIVGNVDLDANTEGYTVTDLDQGVSYDFFVWAYNSFDVSPTSLSVNLAPVDLGTPIVEVSPSAFTLDDPITITFYPGRAYPAGDLVGESKIYFHSGLIPPGSENQSGWTNAPGNVWGTDNGSGEMIYNGDPSGSWSITIDDPRAYYGVDGSYVASQIGMIFRNVEGNLVGGDGVETAGGFDIFVDVFDPFSVDPPGGALAIGTDGVVGLLDSDAQNPSAYDITGDQVTIEIWVNAETLDEAGGNTLFSRREFDSGSQVYRDAYSLYYNNQEWVFEVFDGSLNSAYVSSSFLFGTETWIHLAGVYDGVNAYLYVNGMEVASQPFTGNVYQPTEGPYLQIHEVNTNLMAVDDARIWNTARTTEEIRLNLSNSLDGDEFGLVGYWKMDGTFEDEFSNIWTPDETFNGNNLLVQGTVGPDVKPDLIITSISLSTNSVRIGESFDIFYTIQNDGDGDADAPNNLRTGLHLSTDGSINGIVYFLGWVDENTNFIAAGDFINGSASTGILGSSAQPDIPEGDFYVLIEVDYNNEVDEGNNDGNMNYYWNSTGGRISILPELVDEDPPVISFSPPDGWEEEDFTFDFTVSDADGTVSEVLFYKRPAAQTNDPQPISLSSGNSTYTASVNASDFDNVGVTVWVRATDDSGNSDVTSRQTIVRRVPDNIEQSITGIKTGTEVTDYQIIAYPYQSANISQIFQNFEPQDKTKYRVFTCTTCTGSYNEVTRLEPTKGYWLISNTGNNQITFSGAQTIVVDESAPLSFSLRQGWNLIGNPYLMNINWTQALGVNEVLSPGISSDLGPLVIYNSGYGTTQALNKYQGAFIYANASYTFFVPFAVLSGGRTEQEFGVPRPYLYEKGGWEVVMDIEAANGWRYGVAGFGEYDEATSTRDKFDMTPPPMFDEFLVATFEDEELNGLTRNITEYKEENVWTFSILSHEKRSTITSITFNGTPNVDEGDRIVLFDIQNGNMIDIHNKAEYEFAYSPGYTFKVIKGSDAFIAEQARLESVIVNSIYPNPTNGQFTLPMVLPESESPFRVGLTMTDLSGREVHRLTPISLVTGVHQLELDLDEAIRNKGIYILTIRIDQVGKETITLHQKLYLTE